MLLFKHIFNPDLREKLPGIFSLMNDLLEQDTGLKHLETLLRYLFSTTVLPPAKDEPAFGIRWTHAEVGDLGICVRIVSV